MIALKSLRQELRMEISEPSIISLDTYDPQNRRRNECPSLHEILLIINKMLTECREDFFSLYPKRPVDDVEQKVTHWENQRFWRDTLREAYQRFLESDEYVQ